MKKSILLLVSFCALSIHAQVWNPLSSDTLSIYNYLNDPVSQAEYLAVEQGILVKSSNTSEWTLYSNGMLPTLDLIPFNDSSILAVMGNGTYSDGIYQVSTDFYICEWLLNPVFVKKYDNVFYAGGDDGLMISFDGSINWELEFDNKRIADIIIDGYNHLVFEETDSTFAVHKSTDGGITWNVFPLFGGLPLNDVEITDDHKIFMAVGGTSYSSGLYSSVDFLQSYEVEYYTANLNSIFTAGDNIYMGWNDGFTTQKGIAVWDDLSNSVLSLNEDLPCLDINKITTNPALNCPNILVCTDSGAYSRCVDVGISEEVDGNLTFNLFPNPFYNHITVDLQHWYGQSVDLEIFDVHGRTVFTQNSDVKIGDTLFKLALNKLNPGIYFLKIKGETYTEIVRIIKQ